MIIAITSTGDTLESTLDPKFGRCTYIVIYNTENQTTEFIPNTHKNIEEGAGAATVDLVASKNASKIISGEFGEKIKLLLDSLKIQMIVFKQPNKKIKTIIEMLNH